ncbi:Type IV secretory pathway, VirJ component [Tistlia consotensis]|uniref:Type IV secretory pathway, VirJ component n=1 Tax=Tistlia consotensis USBA 355 TaxID=560819 RepID=A0A1Y6CJI3_9PROT|nr:AcvB/VirJ family lysyl-phosphatidylglycerol hydrolase [Tistlia consotensis]SMF70529.1 Type IV secretory pathway, VirJ component [Tistlia consotensis USBA 355]SNS04946.1 Type IV secretory pathway, VirJ component [Tistlia consotensis]
MRDLLLAFLATAFLLPLPAAAAPSRDSDGRLADLRLYNEAAVDDGLVFLFSEGAGWSATDEEDARAVAAAGYAVVGLDGAATLARAQAAEQGECIYLVSDIEALSKALRRRAGAASYHSPVLAGRGLGGLLAEVALAQAPAATVAGAAAIAPDAALPGRLPFCPGARAERRDAGFGYALQADLPGWLDARADAGGGLVAAIQEGQAGRDGDGPLSDLPLVALPSQGRPRALAVVFSGDGGWRDLDKQIAEILAKRGVAAVGWDSLRYFWSEKTPATVAADLSRVLRHYRKAWAVDRVLLIGYSFGADILPAVIADLPATDRSAVVQVSLLGLGPSAHFKIEVEGWLGIDAAGGSPIEPALDRLAPGRVQCFMGREEEDSLCRNRYFDSAERIVTDGGHHFDGDYEALAARILAGLDKRG